MASGLRATVGGGEDNEASGEYSTVPGGESNLAQGDHSFAAGQGARALHQGTFVWADDCCPDFFSSTNALQFLIRAKNGVGINTNSLQGDLDVNGSIYQRGAAVHADYVFEDDYQLESIEEHSRSMWRDKHLPAVGPGEKDEQGREFVEYGSRMRGILEELEKAHIYIEQLHNRNRSLQTQVRNVQQSVAELARKLGN